MKKTLILQLFLMSAIASFAQYGSGFLANIFFIINER